MFIIWAYKNKSTFFHISLSIHENILLKLNLAHWHIQNCSAVFASIRRYNDSMFRNSRTVPQNTSNYILGINIASERTLIVYGNPSGLVNERVEFTSAGNLSFPGFLSEVSSHVDRLLMITQAQRLPLPDVVSVSVAGNYDPQTGIIDSSPEFSEWKSEALRSQLGLRLNLPVYAETKANAGLLAELLFGGHGDLTQAFYLTFSPRVRVSILSDGQLYHNTGLSAGTLGKVRLAQNSSPGERFQTLDDLASGAGLLGLADFRHSNHWEPGLLLTEFIQSALDQDPYSIEIVEEAARFLGRNLESLVHVLHPETIIVGYPYHLLGDIWLKPMAEALSQASGLAGSQLPLVLSSKLGHRQPELEALAPAIMALRANRTS